MKRTFVKEWRKFRNLTQVQLADRVGIAQGSLSDLERGDFAYTQPMLEALADALGCAPADLIMRDPTAPNPIWSIWDQIPSQQRDQAAKVLETFVKKTGTDN